MNNKQSVEIYAIIANLRNGLWLIGIPSWLFGITDRSLASIADGYLSAIDLMQVFTASLFFLSWLYLKPEESFSGGVEGNAGDRKLGLCPIQTRKFELPYQHTISQEYILPFPHLCQIYHLLNLKHLESIHNFSLNNLKVIKVTDFQPTALGGAIKFQTILDSPFNALRIWRQPIVEVLLILHTPYTVELNIPVNGDKRIIVMFYVFPINDREHQFCIDIYSNLNWPKPLLQILLHFASCLTLFEDLPYLQKIAEKNLSRLFNPNTVSDRETMLLFKRFVELYGSVLEPSDPKKALEPQQ
ncbi:hypothetical protein [Aerosakkonema funiforme]|uniref:Uncharacterized protein n=1 Tax=Aerosakkonema funiforme FACHB-1375 TaxID=2949571 RepID=A0A926VHN7_9CYAN|nr:hypothetical protein [Aerosakkonema funiforme]MBD2184096.1 hypothetical protein [Aerosakkonema funiforme FACHB-1375]